MARFSFGRHAHGPGHGGASSATGTVALDPSTGPGWYDSSWELRHGLVVHEGFPADAQLHEWLEHHLRIDAAGSSA